MITLDLSVLATCVSTVLAIVGLVYMIMRNFKMDINSHIDRLEKRMDLVDERMFSLMTGKSLADAIKEERLKNKEK